MSTYSTHDGHVKAVRWEWGIGKGAWRRGVRKAFPDVRIRRIWFGIGSRYTLDHQGGQRVSENLYEAI